MCVIHGLFTCKSKSNSNFHWYLLKIKLETVVLGSWSFLCFIYLFVHSFLINFVPLTENDGSIPEYSSEVEMIFCLQLDYKHSGAGISLET